MARPNKYPKGSAVMRSLKLLDAPYKLVQDNLGTLGYETMTDLINAHISALVKRHKLQPKDNNANSQA